MSYPYFSKLSSLLIGIDILYSYHTQSREFRGRILRSLSLETGKKRNIECTSCKRVFCVGLVAARRVEVFHSSTLGSYLKRYN